ncbi:MAG: SapB/AmfS family lanthipeptide [Actinobacteria bacterium]|nr:SapB/AmfS family lanthipeptide [Actinomycetota bacterium]
MILLDLQGMQTPEASSNKLGLGSSYCDDDHGGDGSDISLLLCGDD